MNLSGHSLVLRYLRKLFHKKALKTYDFCLRFRFAQYVANSIYISLVNALVKLIRIYSFFHNEKKQKLSTVLCSDSVIIATKQVTISVFSLFPGETTSGKLWENTIYIRHG